MFDIQKRFKFSFEFLSSQLSERIETLPGLILTKKSTQEFDKVREKEREVLKMVGNLRGKNKIY